MKQNVIDRLVLGKAWAEAFERLHVDLGDRFSRLKCSRTATRHGTRTSVFICRIYDSRQSEATLPWGYCCYGLNYDPVDFETDGHNWCLKLHLNTERLYFAAREEVIRLLKRELPKVCPPGFNYRPHPRQQVIERQFNHAGTEYEVVASALPHLRRLLENTYPVLDQAIRLAEGSVLDKSSRRALVQAKVKAHAPAANPAGIGNRRALSRSIPPSLRAAVIAANRHGKCGICGFICDPEDIHIDHIKSVANGGLTELENLQVTCSKCNLKKGSGRARSVVAHIPAKPRHARRQML